FRWAALCILAVGAVSTSVCAVAATVGAHAQLEIYFIDVEGGQSTLVVTPDRHSLLIDTGFAGDGSGFRPGDPAKARDANRIVAAARDAGIDRIDYLLITHFHTDHDGGVTELSRLLPIRTFVDHEAPSAEAVSTSPETREAFAAYQTVRGANQHITPKPGDRLPLQDAEVTVVSSAGATLPRPMSEAGTRNAACSDHAMEPRDQYENPRSTGVVIRYGRFRFLDVGDLTGPPLFKLACPADLVGPVDAYLVAHHGGPDTMIGETFGAFKPRVAIMNNGQTKGGALETYQALHHVPGLEDVWQLHAASVAADSNFPPQYIANLDESTASWIKLIASADGSFRVLNQRTGQWKHYPPRAP
ncbi:MAG TPA: MBL fold metallo-hydrolase, partial [Steroidobacteraceae bacterium]|nr:MBL fold metallo-hydrolase [Steroidobacteraceae bacterium]